jgi:Fis family transcriptional regulator
MPYNYSEAKPLREHVKQVIRRYIADMGATETINLHQRLLAEVEPPLIEEVLRCAAGNQSRAAKILGITRNTLRSRMKRYGIDPKKRLPIA